MSIDLANTKWRPFSKALNQQKGFFPNRVFFNAEDREAAVVIDKSGRGDFALSQRALDYVLEAQGKQDKVLRSFIVLRDRQANEIVASLPASDVRSNIRSAEPLRGDYGPFWWINKDFHRASMEVEDDPM